MGNVDISGMMQKLQQLQAQVNQLNQMQNPSTTTQPNQKQTTYPKAVKDPESVEDILANPTWRSELQEQFNASELGAKARAHMDVMFSEFCEKATGYKSSMLEGLRKQNNANKGKSVPKKNDKEENNGA